MPIKRCTLPNGEQGYQWGSSGKCYADRADAEKQMEAAYANGYKEKDETDPREPRMKIASEEKRLVFAEVYAPDIPDSNNDYMTAEEIEHMAHKFMRQMFLREVDTEHDGVSVDGCCVVESFIARKGDDTFIEGAWVVGMHIDNDEYWHKIKSGEINGFSMEAWVRSKPMTVEVELPPVISGTTTKAEDGHSHEYFVSYSDEGNFLGGRTSAAADGHFHVIKSGTVTEEAKDHSHRFNAVQGIRIVSTKEGDDE